MGNKTQIQSNTILYSSEISPDGSYVVFSYKYKNLFNHIAIVDIDKNPLKLIPIYLPPSQDWIYPTFSQNMKYIAATTYCEKSAPFNCHEGVTGFQIWRLGIEDKSFEIITPKNSNIRRTHPVFKSGSDTIYYIASDANKNNWPTMFIATSDQNDEYIFFPERIGDSLLGEKTWLTNLRISTDINRNNFSFLATIGDGPKSLMKKIKRKKNRIGTFLFYYDGSTIKLIDDDVVDCFASSTNDSEYIYAQRDGSQNYLTYVYVNTNGKKEKLFTFNGYIHQLSTSLNNKRVLFLGSQDGDDVDIWLYDNTKNTLKCLYLKEVINSEVPILIDRELYDKVK